MNQSQDRSNFKFQVRRNISTYAIAAARAGWKVSNLSSNIVPDAISIGIDVTTTNVPAKSKKIYNHKSNIDLEYYRKKLDRYYEEPNCIKKR